MTVLTLVAGQVSLDQLADIYWYQRPVILNSECRPAVQLAADQIAAAVGGGAAFYGVNTGFGKLASVKVEAGDTETLQRNLILSHCCGVGEATPRDIVRLMMALKLISFGRGASGVRWALIEVLQNLLLAGVTPIVSA